MTLRRLAIAALLAAFSLPAHAELCQEWSAPEKVGALDTNFLNEASGLALSKQFPGRLYHNNDSGDGPFFYVTDHSGKGTQRVAFDSEKPVDVEDVAVGPCPSGQCLFVGDIGDNKRVRDHLTLWMIPEQATFPEKVRDARHLTLVYPDHAHDAESLAVHPITGDVYLLTKEADYNVERRAHAARLYRLPRALLNSAGADSSISLEFVGEIDLPWMLYDLSGLFGQIATSMDISPDGKNLLLLTYQNAVEIPFDRLQGPIFSRSWEEGKDYRVIRWPELVSQQEAIVYGADGNSFYFDTEYNPDYGDKEAPLYRVSCLKR